ncbi:competence protein CoiA [Bradyrhizobium nanningense]|uniref:competence protein CoiA n=1 Tax=Bradyrhizobium nanningense TaxID=1325118 RepID=UPI00100896FE|nr:competence protein CoiA family protein [Bradyrhizobium nanningense]
MRYAVVGGQRVGAYVGGRATCPYCNGEVIAKCGTHRVAHWSHRGMRDCDTWAENETDWHQAWKNRFPIEWQEIGYTAQSGERHRADVKTQSGLVLEFQYSALSEAERISREQFYTRLVWIVHADRRLRDRKNFFASLSGPLHVASRLPTFTIHRDDSALLRDWGRSRAPVYFDFGETKLGRVLKFV